MDFFLASLGAFWIIRTAKLVLGAPKWFWSLATLVVSVGATLLLFNWTEVYVGLAVAGAVEFLQHFEDLLMVKGDEIVTNVTTRRHTR